MRRRKLFSLGLALVPGAELQYPNAFLGFLEETIGIAPQLAHETSRDIDLDYRFASRELWGRILFLGEPPLKWRNWLVQNCLPESA